MNRKQRRAEGKGGQGVAATSSRGSSGALDDQMFQQALHFHQTGRMRDAEAGYRDLLARNPRHAGALCYLGLLAHQSGHGDAGVDLLRKAIAAEKRNPDVHYNLACMLADMGRDDEAVQHNRKAIEFKPDYIAAHGNLSALLLLRGQFDEALSAVLRGLKIEETKSLTSTFVLLVQSIDPAAIEAVGDVTRFLTRALTAPWSRPRDLSAAAAGMLMRDPAMVALIGRASSDTLPSGIALSSDERAAISRNALLKAMLSTSPVTNVAIERFLTAMRRVLLDEASASASAPEGWLSLASSLAQQCFINDYVFAVSDGERAQLADLRAIIEKALQSGEAVAPIQIAVLASYLPLHALAGADTLASREWPERVAALVAQQILDPRAERAIRPAIERLTALNDTVSEQVRNQYEESPYPQWTKVVGNAQPLPVDHYMRMRFPGAPYRNLGNGPVNLLVAGCGTGMHAIQRAQLFANTNVLAIDLSLSSLSYAVRKTKEMGIANIRYAQADILEFASETAFDVIDSSGVLHHLRNPQEGWRRLAGMVRPGGLMHIGLYSAIARQAINAARARFAEQGRQFSPDEARRLRADILKLPANDELSKVTQFSDFFSMSEFRDLLFHVQEHQLSLPQISSFLSENGFTFVGFETQARQAYLKRFPDDPAAVNLANWNTFEIENPATFAHMYQFWIQKT